MITNNYKMILTNTATIINDYKLGSCPTLERNFMIWDPAYHKYNILGMHYDPKTEQLYVPRGSDISYIKRKIQMTMEPDEDITTTVYRAHKYGYTKNIRINRSISRLYK